MGYYTRYELVPLDSVLDVKDIIEKIREVRGADDEVAETLEYVLNEGSTKWYEHDEDMKAVSLLFPGVLFELSGEGEESGDLWRTYYKDGKMQHSPANTSYPPYNEALLR